MTPTAANASLSDRIDAVRERMELACQRAGRRSGDVTLIAVSKTWPAEAVAEAAAEGLTNFGENRVQEAIAKIDHLSHRPAHAGLTWHLIGHLQTNKVRAAAGRFAILHAVDSERLLHAVAANAREPQRVMIEVNVSGEATKFGVSPAGLESLLAAAATVPMVRVEGLMTVAPLAADPEASRPYFRSLRSLAGQHGLAALSMGMTGDFEVAIEEGATHIRVGRAIFGERA